MGVGTYLTMLSFSGTPKWIFAFLVLFGYCCASEHGSAKRVQRKLEESLYNQSSENLGLLSNCLEGGLSIRIMKKIDHFSFDYIKGTLKHSQIGLLDRRVEMLKNLKIILYSALITVPCLTSFVR